eukprot:1374943-Amorphochlora_amoeboformis.AAC.1
MIPFFSEDVVHLEGMDKIVSGMIRQVALWKHAVFKTGAGDFRVGEVDEILRGFESMHCELIANAIEYNFGPSRTPNQLLASNQENFQGSTGMTSEADTKLKSDDQGATPPANLTPQASRATDSNLESETKFSRTKMGLRELLSRFDISEEMYVKLARIVGCNYRTSAERVQAVQQKLSEWKNAGTLRALKCPDGC